jgi:signal transduction histidine kinase
MKALALLVRATFVRTVTPPQGAISGTSSSAAKLSLTVARRVGSHVRRLVAVALVLVTLCGVGLAAPAERQKQVLVLYATRRDAQIATLGERELPAMLDRGMSTRLDYYSEYIDRARFPEPEYRAALRDFLYLKYKDVTFDIVIAMSDVSLEFLAESRDDLFRGTPVVFFSTTRTDRPFANATGFRSPTNYVGSLMLAAALQPGLKNVYVVSGDGSDDRSFAIAATAQLRRHESQFHIEYLTGLTTRDLDARLPHLPPNSMIYYTVVDRDGAGRVFHPLDYLDHISSVANAPVYTWVDSGMGHGVVGGSLKDQTLQIDELAGLALRVLQGEAADQIPIVEHDLNVVQVDWRQLTRWGISEARVPPGTLIRFREPTLWDRYRDYILLVATILVAETTLIVALLLQRRRRREAERQLRGSEAQLRSSYQRIRDLGGRLLNAQESERSHIARELHDDVSQQLALLAIDLELLKRPGATQFDELSRSAITRTEGIARSIHDLSHRLHPARLRLIGLLTALDGLRRELSRPDLEITLTHSDVSSTLSPDLTLCLYRVVQEALQNAIKYSRARHISVDLRGHVDTLTLSIADDGAGFDVSGAWGQGLGLISMRERLEAIGGTFDILSTTGSGTRLDITVPLRPVEDAAPAGV